MPNPRLVDLSGRKFGQWTVGNQAGNDPRGGALWACRCSCGVERAVSGADLRAGKSRGCGCSGAGRLGDLARTHGGTGSRLYQIWVNMLGRCEDEKRASFRNYGGRGIAVCQEWRSFSRFRDWAVDSGYLDKLTIERIDVNGNYEPKNCTWIPAELQSRNRRMVQRAADGELWLHKALAAGISRSAFAQRTASGWPLHEAASWPMRRRRNPHARDANGQFR